MSVLTLCKTRYSEITLLSRPVVFTKKNSHRTGKLKPTQAVRYIPTPARHSQEEPRHPLVGALEIWCGYATELIRWIDHPCHTINLIVLDDDQIFKCLVSFEHGDKTSQGRMVQCRE